MGKTIQQYVAVRCSWGADDIPNPKDNELQIYYNGETVEMIDFLCPCGCGHRCPTHVVPLAEKMDPNQNRSVWKDHCWGFDPTTLQVHPSIRWLSGCKAHFNIEAGGRVVIHADSGK